MQSVNNKEFAINRSETNVSKVNEVTPTEVENSATGLKREGGIDTEKEADTAKIETGIEIGVEAEVETEVEAEVETEVEAEVETEVEAEVKAEIETER